MELKKHNRRLRSINKSLLSLFSCFLFFFFTVCALFSTSNSISSKTTCLGIRSCQSSVKADLSFQLTGKRRDGERQEGAAALMSLVGRRLLGGPGSSPPRCTSKCGKCTPCRPVHVPVPPGTPVTAEYYPEAWRCKCGNKLYMP